MRRLRLQGDHLPKATRWYIEMWSIWLSISWEVQSLDSGTQRHMFKSRLCSAPAGDLTPFTHSFLSLATQQCGDHLPGSTLLTLMFSSAVLWVVQQEYSHIHKGFISPLWLYKGSVLKGASSTVCCSPSFRLVFFQAQEAEYTFYTCPCYSVLLKKTQNWVGLTADHRTVELQLQEGSWCGGRRIGRSMK